MWWIMTFINLLGALLVICLLAMIQVRYHVGARMGFFMFLTMVSMLLLVFSQAYALAMPPGDWKLKLVSLFWWLKGLYFCWAIRFSSIKK